MVRVDELVDQNGHPLGGVEHIKTAVGHAATVASAGD